MEEERGNGEMNKKKNVRVKVAVLKKENWKSAQGIPDSRHTDRLSAGWRRKRSELAN
jgi:hypothetical protein